MQLNSCAGSYSGEVAPDRIVQEGDSPDLVAAVSRALTAVPDDRKVAFFSHGNIVLTADVASACDQAMSEDAVNFASEQGELEACWDLSAQGKASIILQADADVIRHHLVRMFGFLQTQLYGSMLETVFDTAGENTQSDYQNFRRHQEDLADTFWQRLDELGVDLPLYKDMIPKDSAGRRTFEDFVYGEAFDSYFCNADTRQHFATTFPKAHAIFASQLNATPPTRSRPKGFGLQDVVGDRYVVGGNVGRAMTASRSTDRLGRAFNQNYARNQSRANDLFRQATNPNYRGPIGGTGNITPGHMYGSNGRVMTPATTTAAQGLITSSYSSAVTGGFGRGVGYASQASSAVSSATSSGSTWYKPWTWGR